MTTNEMLAGALAIQALREFAAYLKKAGYAIVDTRQVEVPSEARANMDKLILDALIDEARPS